MLHDGRWHGRQIVSADYADNATEKSSTKLNAAYGLLWWVNKKGPVLGAATALGDGTEQTSASRLARRAPHDTFWALGAGRQILAVIPSKNIVAIRMGVAPADPNEMSPDSFTGDVMDALR
jgi:CubicO group peptidase (beta-lactamase class C family)